jgi:hypothetical protein
VLQIAETKGEKAVCRLGEALCAKTLYCDLFSQLAIDGELFMVWQWEYLLTDQLA